MKITFEIQDLEIAKALIDKAVELAGGVEVKVEDSQTKRVEEEPKPKDKTKKKPAKKETKKGDLTIEDILATVDPFIAKYGSKPVQALLKKIGVEKLAKLKKENYPEFLERLNAYDAKQEAEIEEDV